MEVNLKHSIGTRFSSFSKEFRSKVIYPAHNRSLKRSKATAKRVIVDAVTQKLNARKSSVKEMINTKIMSKNLHATVDDRGMPLGQFGPREKRRKRKSVGVTVQIKKGRGKKTFTNAFIAKNKNGKKAVFERVGKSRLPVTELFSSRAADIAQNKNTKRQIIEEVRLRYSKEFDHNVKFYEQRFVERLKKDLRT